MPSGNQLSHGLAHTGADGKALDALGRNGPNGGTDGPATTHVGFMSGCTWANWDPVHKALWCGGPDETRLRWLKDGWVKTVITRKQGQLVWCGVFGVSPKGQIYITGASAPYGVWRARNVKEAKP